MMEDSIKSTFSEFGDIKLDFECILRIRHDLGNILVNIQSSILVKTTPQERQSVFV